MTLEEIRKRQEEITEQIEVSRPVYAEWKKLHRQWLALQRRADELESVLHAQGESRKYPLKKERS